MPTATPVRPAEVQTRPAVLHKDLLSQAEVLVCLGMTSPRDIGAVDEWIRLHADEDQAREMRDSLPSLPVGTAWIWSPSWLQILQQVKIRARSTFDSSATPRPGIPRPSATTFADVDLARLQERLTDLTDIVPEQPAHWKARVAELERQLAAARAKPSPPPVRVEVPVLSDADRILLTSAATAQGEILGRLPSSAETPAMPAPATAPTPTRRPPNEPSAQGSAQPSSADVAGLPKAQRLIVSALALHGPLSPTAIAVLTGYSSTSGGFRNSVYSLRSAGLIEGRDPLSLTSAVNTDGLEHLPAPGADLIAWWKQHHLGKAHRAILDALVAAAPHPLTKEEIAAVTGYSPTSGGFRNALYRLRSLNLAIGRDKISLSPTIYPS